MNHSALSNIPWDAIKSICASLSFILSTLVLMVNRTQISLWFLSRATLVARILSVTQDLRVAEQRVKNAEALMISWKGFADAGSATRAELGAVTSQLAEVNRQVIEMRGYYDNLALRFNLAIEYINETSHFTHECVRRMTDNQIALPGPLPALPAELFEDFK